MTIYSHIDADDGQHPYPHPHHHHRHGRCAVSPFGIGPRGKDGEKGEKGDTFTFDDLTDAQLAELREGVSTVYYRKSQETYYTSGTLTSSIEVPIAFSDRDMLFVNVEGLDLVEGRDYTVSGNTIVLAAPITHSGTRVNFTVLTAVAATAADLSEFWDGIADATSDAHGLMSAADKAKLDGIMDGAAKITLSDETGANPPYGRIVSYNPGGAYDSLTVPTLNNFKLIKGDNIPIMSPSQRGGAKMGSGLVMVGDELGIKTMSPSQLGGAKLGDGLEISGTGVLGVASKVPRAYMTLSDMRADTGLDEYNMAFVIRDDTDRFITTWYTIAIAQPADMRGVIQLQNDRYAVPSTGLAHSMGEPITELATTADTATIIAKVNDILDVLDRAGIVAIGHLS